MGRASVLHSLEGGFVALLAQLNDIVSPPMQVFTTVRTSVLLLGSFRHRCQVQLLSTN
jgi:hypothetical protein